MTEQATTKGNAGNGQEPNQVNMRPTQEDRQQLAHLRTVTGLSSLSEIIRYALKYTADRHPISPAPVDDITPTLILDIAGLTAILKAFVIAATSCMDKESEDYRFFVTDLLLHIGDPMGICALLAEKLPEQAIVWRYSHATHLQYELATACLVQNGISLDPGSEKRGQAHGGLTAFGTVLSELRTRSKKLAFSGEKPLERVRSVGNRDPKRSQFGAKVGKPCISSLVVF